ncbi:MAG: DNA translocase FtsK 4TM domain-containing protein, partial [Pseudomonadota bacterium]
MHPPVHPMSLSPLASLFFRSLHRILACLACAFGLLGAVALATWTISDPSLTFANGSEAENWLGFWGASFADLSMQFLGFASLLLVAAPFVWGLMHLTRRIGSPLLVRLSYGLGGLVCISAALGCVSISQGWPLAVGYGGVVGDAVLNIPRAFMGTYPSGFSAVFFSTIFSMVGLWLLFRAFDFHRGIWTAPKEAAGFEDGLRSDARGDFQSDTHSDGFDEDPYEDSASGGFGAVFALMLGFLLHVLMSAWTSVKRLFGFTAKPRYQPYPFPQDTPPEAGYAAFENSDAEPAVSARLEPSFETRTAPVSAATSPMVPHGPASYDQADYDQPAVDSAPWEDDGFIDPVDQPSAAALSAAGGANDLAQPIMRDVPVDAAGDDDPVPHTDAAQPVVERSNARVRKPQTKKGRFLLPELDLLSEAQGAVEDPSLSTEALQENAHLLEGVLDDFGVKGQIIKVRPGPVVTLYELEPAPGVKSSRVIGLAEDIARSMSAIAARVAVVPGRNAIGIELPN